VTIKGAGWLPLISINAARKIAVQMGMRCSVEEITKETRAIDIFSA